MSPREKEALETLSSHRTRTNRRPETAKNSTNSSAEPQTKPLVIRTS